MCSFLRKTLLLLAILLLDNSLPVILQTRYIKPKKIMHSPLPSAVRRTKNTKLEDTWMLGGSPSVRKHFFWIRIRGSVIPKTDPDGKIIQDVGGSGSYLDSFVATEKLRCRKGNHKII